ncbi:MAG: hypothetical protein C4520_15835 [Candidatus Abyssobacteria bacterium SURF_5]|uniref:Uncharacterized protein n=1 Tax=Abyssobacteria bacterium (strain SURF_5) TaxID=2093360 RepID=A0A3A4NE61_ABYX5|nr:MAG: hypothetical protein C4520_15835 [Candidatus Abyssubacteria bacterium SURF_5]
MRVLPPQEERRREVELLCNLQDDMAVLENGWQKKKIPPPKAVSHLCEILESIRAITRAESLDQFENVCIELEEKLTLVQNKKEKLEKHQWTLVSDLIQRVRESLELEESEIIDLTSDWTAPPACPEGARNGDSPATNNHQTPALEEDQMNKPLQTDAQELLRKAQEALISGNGEMAKDLAMQAAGVLAKIEAQEAQKKEKGLRADLEMAVHEEAEAEEAFNRINEELSDRAKEVDQLNAKLAEADSSFTQHQQLCQQIKEQVEKIEAELASLGQQRKNLLEQFQEALPARDAAERECARLKNDLEKLKPELDMIKESAGAAEAQMAKARENKKSLETQIDRLAARVAS